MDLGRDLMDEIKQDGIIISHLKDIELAKDFYGALCNVEWYVIKPPYPEDEQIMRRLRGDREAYWSCSWRQAGGYIASIRNKHYNTAEGYLDFYCSGEEGVVTELVRENFERLGWIPDII